MRVLIVTQDEPFFMPVYVHRILETHGAVICGVMALPAFRSFREALAYNLSFLGLPAFLWTGTRFVLFKAMSLLPERHRRRSYSVRNAAEGFKTPFYFVERINAPHSRELMESFQPHVILSIAAPQKFGKAVLSIPTHGCFNVHSSLLPKYRGINALFWALLHREETTGVTIHKMDENFDTGPIAVQKTIPIEPRDTVFGLYGKAVRTGAKAVGEFLDAMERDGEHMTLEPIVEFEGFRYFSFPGAEERKQLLQSGRRFFRAADFFDWHRLPASPERTEHQCPSFKKYLL